MQALQFFGEHIQQGDGTLTRLGFRVAEDGLPMLKAHRLPHGDGLSFKVYITVNIDVFAKPLKFLLIFGNIIITQTTEKPTFASSGFPVLSNIQEIGFLSFQNSTRCASRTFEIKDVFFISCRQNFVFRINLFLSQSHELLRFLHHFQTSAEERYALMKFGRLNFKDSLEPIAAFSSRLFCQKCHRITFVKQSQFSVRRL